jgi:hypothetical protein
MKITQFALIAFSFLFLTGFFFSPKLDTKNEVGYKESLQEMFEKQDSDQSRLELANAIAYSMTDGKEGVSSSNDAYNIYGALSFGGQAGRMMSLNGKTDTEIIKIGFELRKQWVLKNLPQKIESYKKKIAELNTRKERAENIAKTKEAFHINKVTLQIHEAIAHGTNIPMGKVSGISLYVEASNAGVVDVYSCSLEIKIVDSTNNKEILSGRIQGDFPEPLKPGTTQRMKIYREQVPILPYDENRYELIWSLASVETQPKGSFFDSERFSDFDRQNLEEMQKELAELEKELAKFE